MVNTDNCWHWAGYIQSNGYGSVGIKIDGTWKKMYAHRLMYTYLMGEIPEGLVIDHLCRVECCINPDHLEAVTQSENMLRALPYMAPIEYCKAGHKLADHSRIKTSNGRKIQYCRLCQWGYIQEYRLRKRQYAPTPPTKQSKL